MVRVAGKDIASVDAEKSRRFRAAVARLKRDDDASSTSASTGLAVRRATEADIPALCAIHNEGIADRTTMDTVPYSLEQKREWFRAHGPKEPVLAALNGDDVVGWISLNRFSPRSSYDHVKDLSIYIRRDWRSRGAGTLLMGAAIDEARRLGLHKLVLSMVSTLKVASKLYRGYGFRKVGVYRRQGKLDGKWVDMVVMERLLDEP